MDENRDEVMEDEPIKHIEESNETVKDITSSKKNKKSNFFFEWIVPIVAAIIIALVIRKFLIFKAYIPSGSMIPTLNVGDQLFVTRIYNYNSIDRGDVIVFNSKELDDVLIKRVIGLPGDKVVIKDGKVSVNGEELDESYVVNKENTTQWDGEYDVPEGKYFFLGDNRPISYDSRKWQNPYIDASDIIAKARLRVYPFSDFGTIK